MSSETAETSRLKSTDLRSHRWFGPDDLRSFGHRSRARQMGWGPPDWEGKPVIAILNTWSELMHCHLHFKISVESVKRGVLQAGGMPVEIPVMALAENFMKPTTMLHRNLLAMEVEEVLRGYPVDGAILLGGCDKTVPGLVMGALSAGLPFIFVPAGPMVKGNWRGQTLGSGSDVWKYWDERRAGNLDECAWQEIEDGIARSNGTCMTMGTASTLAAIVDAMGLTLPGASSIPAVDATHQRVAAEAGRQIVGNVWSDLRPSRFLTLESFKNGITCDMAIGGSTNAIVHLAAMAGRCGIELPLKLFDEISKRTPWLANIRPAGHYLMEDFYFAGGLKALLKELGDLIDQSQMTIMGQTLQKTLATAEIHQEEVICRRNHPLSTEGGTAILFGSLAPEGAVIKHSAASPELLVHTGPAIVFKDMQDLRQRLDDPDLPITKESVMVLQNAGPVGGPGMPEWGMLPLPKKLLQQGVRDLIRISDARMSGTSYGTCVLHISPESAVGGPLALAKDGDLISLDVPRRRLDLLVPEEEMERRRQLWKAPVTPYQRGWTKLYQDQVTQAPLGCDFAFLRASDDQVGGPEPAIF